MARQELQRTAHAVFDLHYHVVLVTKYRRRCLTEPTLVVLEQTVKAVVERWGGRVEEFNGEVDHVHLLLSLPPIASPATVIGRLKSQSARRLRAQFRRHFDRYFWRPGLWSRSYCVVSCGGAPLTVIRQYIERQNRPL